MPKDGGQGRVVLRGPIPKEPRSLHGWVVLPIAVEPGYEHDPKTYEFENNHAYYEDYGGDISFVSADEAPTFFDAVMQLRKGVVVKD